MKAVSFIVSHPGNKLKGTFNTHPSLLSLRKTSSFLEVGVGICPSKTIFAPFYSTLCSNRQKLFNHLRSISGNRDNAQKVREPTAVMYTTKLITRLCNSGLIDSAIDVLEEMVGMGCKPNVVTYSMVIDSLFERGRVDCALKLFREMAFHRGILPDAVSYSSFLHAIRILSRRDDISKMLKDMEDKGNYVGPKTFNIFVDAYCKEGRMEDAESQVNDSEKDMS